MKWELFPLAAVDLLEIGDYIARYNPERAERFVREFLAHSLKIADLPEAYPARGDLAEVLRSCVHQQYFINFTVSTTALRIERIRHDSPDITSDNFLLD